ncbi:MAG TPA: DUF262 domain-containing protein [Chloroflexia bacterium]|jgi:hypothetical protein
MTEELSGSRFISIPAPEVQHLTTVFRRIQSGELRIPAFQRGFVWHDQQIIEILESVYRGYPVGSILLWKSAASQDVHLRTTDASNTAVEVPIPFPHLPVTVPTTYVLDGMQRLSALYGVFYASSLHENFDVVFDLVSREFNFTRTVDEDDARYIPLATVFVPRKLLDAQSRMAIREDGDTLIDASLGLLQAFQEYLLPIVTITASGLNEVVEIFERVNSTGTKLGRIDFMRALTWSEAFDLNYELRQLRQHFISLNFDYSEETLIKALSILLGKDPTPSAMVELRNFSAQELHMGIARTREVLERVILFLRQECGVLSSAFVPYEGQTLVLTRIFGTFPNPSHDITAVARAWFWSTSLSEALRGKADHYVTRAINSVNRLEAGDLKALTQRLLLTPETLLERRLINEKALSTAIVSLFGKNDARSLLTGEVIDPESYMVSFKPDFFEAIVPIGEIRHTGKRGMPSAKLLANICLIPTSTRRSLPGGNSGGSAILAILSVTERLGDEHGRLTLASQFISEEALSYLLLSDFTAFLRVRANDIFQATLALVEGRL